MPQDSKILSPEDRIDWSMVAGVCMLKNEVDIIGLNLEHLIGYGLKCFVIFDDGSTDGSQAIIEEIMVRHKGLDIIILQGRDHFLNEVAVFRQMTLIAKNLFNKEWAFGFDADDFLWLSPGLKIDLAESGADYILMPWLHVNPADITEASISGLRKCHSLENVTLHKSKTLIRISETVRMKSGQHNVINEGLAPAIGLDGLTLGMASVHFPIRSEEQLVSKFSATADEPQYNITQESRTGKHRYTMRDLSRTDTGNIYQFLINRDEDGFLDFCKRVNMKPEMFDYLASLICNTSTAFPHPGKGWQSKYSPKRFHLTNRSSLLGKAVGSIAKRLVRINSGQYRAATVSELDSINQ